MALTTFASGSTENISKLQVLPLWYFLRAILRQLPPEQLSNIPTDIRTVTDKWTNLNEFGN